MRKPLVGRKTVRRAAVTIGVLGSACFGQTPQFNSGVTTGTLQNASITEASGIAASRMNYNVLWTHNDSGNPAQIFPFTKSGTNLGIYSVSGATNVDWEDIAIGPGPLTNSQYIYVGD